MSTDLYLINDDEPGQFEPRRVRIEDRHLIVEDRAGVAVELKPELTEMPGGRLERAILVPRRPADSIGEWSDAVRSPVSVFVFRWPDNLRIGDRREFSRSELAMPFWGRLGRLDQIRSASE